MQAIDWNVVFLKWPVMETLNATHSLA